MIQLCFGALNQPIKLSAAKAEKEARCDMQKPIRSPRVFTPHTTNISTFSSGIEFTQYSISTVHLQIVWMRKALIHPKWPKTKNLKVLRWGLRSLLISRTTRAVTKIHGLDQLSNTPSVRPRMLNIGKVFTRRPNTRVDIDLIQRVNGVRAKRKNLYGRYVIIMA